MKNSKKLFKEAKKYIPGGVNSPVRAFSSVNSTPFFIKKANQSHKIQTIVKPALETLDELNDKKFDMVFIDADKMNYKMYYEKSLRLVNHGGLIIFDNVLWHGEVADEKNDDKFTINIREFNKFVSEDKRVEQIIIPLGDGMTVCRVL